MVATPITAEEYEEMQRIAREHCGHAPTWRTLVVDVVDASPKPLQRVRLRCDYCGTWLSLGHSDEHASEAIEIEIKAAEIAAAVREPVDVFIVEELTASERIGWCGWVEEQSLGFKLELAGWLARQIHDHAEDS